MTVTVRVTVTVTVTRTTVTVTLAQLLLVLVLRDQFRRAGPGPGRNPAAAADGPAAYSQSAAWHRRTRGPLVLAVASSGYKFVAWAAPLRLAAGRGAVLLPPPPAARRASAETMPRTANILIWLSLVVFQTATLSRLDSSEPPALNPYFYNKAANAAFSEAKLPRQIHRSLAYKLSNHTTPTSLFNAAVRFHSNLSDQAEDVAQACYSKRKSSFTL